MADWVGVGTLLLDGYAEEPQNSVLRTEMEAGVAKQRPVSSLEEIQRPLVYRFTQAEYAAFKTWRRGTINNGADWFNWTDPLDGTVKQVRIVGGKYTAQLVNNGSDAPLAVQVSFRVESVE